MKKFDMSRVLYIILMIIIFGLSTAFAQDKQVIISLKTDSYPSESRWALYDSAYQGSRLLGFDSVPTGG